MAYNLHVNCCYMVVIKLVILEELLQILKKLLSWYMKTYLMPRMPASISQGSMFVTGTLWFFILSTS